MVGAAVRLRHPRAQVAGCPDGAARGRSFGRLLVATVPGVGAAVADVVFAGGPGPRWGRHQARSPARRGVRGGRRAPWSRCRIWAIGPVHRRCGGGFSEAFCSAWPVDALRAVGAVSFFVYVFGGLRADSHSACARMSPCFVGQRPVNRTAKPSLRWWKMHRRVCRCVKMRLPINWRGAASATGVAPA